jgi:WD40 repeat protein
VVTNRGHPLHQALSLAPTGQFVVCNDALGDNASTADTLCLFSLPGLAPQTNWPGSQVAQSLDGAVVVHAQDNRLLRRRSVAEPPQLVGESPKKIVKVALSPDGKLAVTAAEPNSGTITFWDLRQRRTPLTAQKHWLGIHMLGFSPDSRWVASASWDRTIGFWDASTGSWKGSFKGHRAPVTSVAFSPDGRTLASGSKDGTVRLWHMLTLAELAVLTAPLGEVWAVAFSPDGQWLLAGGSSGRIQQWRAPSWEELASAVKSTSLEERP